jgi:hypothetical protein
MAMAGSHASMTLGKDLLDRSTSVKNATAIAKAESSRPNAKQMPIPMAQQKERQKIGGTKQNAPDARLCS